MRKMHLIRQVKLINLALIILVVGACGNSTSQLDTSTENVMKDSNENPQNKISENQVENMYSDTEELQSNTENELKEDNNNELTTEQQIQNAKKDGKAVFVVVTETGASNTEKATKIAKGAREIYKNAVIVLMERDDAANASYVEEWRLSGAPLPLILVVSPSGMLAGGYTLEQATAENVAALVPSPKLEKVYEAIGNNKYAIVAFTKKAFTDRSEVLKECKKAVSMLNNEAILVEVDMEDQKEIGFMQQLRINPLNAKSSITMVINKQGQVAGESKSIPDAAKLVSAAKTPVRSGCGPGCGPAGCGK